eukprot:jgi/Botrbrau1/17666/Bobra.0166s0092.1
MVGVQPKHHSTDRNTYYVARLGCGTARGRRRWRIPYSLTRNVISSWLQYKSTQAPPLLAAALQRLPLIT